MGFPDMGRASPRQEGGTEAVELLPSASCTAAEMSVWAHKWHQESLLQGFTAAPSPCHLLCVKVPWRGWGSGTRLLSQRAGGTSYTSCLPPSPLRIQPCQQRSFLP